jgi:RNA polymerase sigma-70 factor (ECF subfamily)
MSAVKHPSPHAIPSATAYTSDAECSPAAQNSADAIPSFCYDSGNQPGNHFGNVSAPDVHRRAPGRWQFRCPYTSFERSFPGTVVDFDGFNKEYLARLRGGDQETANHFCSHFSRLIALKLRVRLRSPQLIEDVAQETLLRVLKVIQSERGFENPDRLPPFVHEVCNRVMLELLRRDTKHPQFLEDTPEPVDGGQDPFDRVVAEDARRLVHRVLGELPERDREILKLVYLQELDTPEICRRFHLEPGYLRVLLHRAKGKFRKYMEEKGPSARAV